MLQAIFLLRHSHEPSEGNAWQERKTEGEEVTAHRPRVAEKGAHAGAINAET